jgi:hypothetical protein
MCDGDENYDPRPTASSIISLDHQWPHVCHHHQSSFVTSSGLRE